MDNISIVTAFFSINRESWSSFSLSNQKYFENFKKWAFINNEMVVFVETEDLKKDIIAFRKKYGLETKTKVIVVGDCLLLDSNLYESIKRVSQNNSSKVYRYRQENPEVWNAQYDYVMMLKFWCLNQAIEKNYISNEMVAWVDFGYAHGDTVKLGVENELEYKWVYPFPKKICLFSVKECDDRPIFDIILSLDTYIQGATFLGPKNLIAELCKYIRSNMLFLNDIGLVDDDQSLLLLTYRQHKELFIIYPCEWCSTLRDYNDYEYIKKPVDSITKKPSLIRRILREIRKRNKDHVFIKKLYKYVRKQKAS